MLIVAGTLEVDPSSRDDFINSRKAAMLASRAEPGCIAYVFSVDPIELGRVQLFERWESKEALAAHLAGQRSTAPPSADIPILSTDILQYEIADMGPLGS